MEKKLWRRRNLVKKTARQPGIPLDDRTGIIVLGKETAGFETKSDEILLLAIIDRTGRVFYYSLVRQVFRYNWQDSVKIQESHLRW